MYTNDIPEYRIDLSLPEHKRWAEVLRAERDVALRFTAEVESQLAVLPAVARAALGLAYKVWGGRYRDEMEAIARSLGLNPRDVLAMQCSYELCQGYEYTSASIFGCTAGVRTFGGHGPVHVRTLDWPIACLGDATRIFRFFEGDREFITVGAVGFVGVLSGMLPGAYSLSINYAPPSERPGFDFGPAFLARQVLETCDTYAEAVAELRDTPLAAPCFFTVCGTEVDEFCVIERGRADAAVRGARAEIICQANHHVSRTMTARNLPFHAGSEEGGTVYAFSKERANTLEHHLQALPSNATLDEIAGTLDVEPVRNDDTYQQMIFAPKTGEWHAWRWVAGEEPPISRNAPQRQDAWSHDARETGTMMPEDLLPEQRESYVGLLCWIAWRDGHVSDAERDYLQRVADLMEVPNEVVARLLRDSRSMTSPAAYTSVFDSSQAAEEVCRSFVVMAVVDGVYGASERVAITRIASHFGRDEDFLANIESRLLTGEGLVRHAGQADSTPIQAPRGTDWQRCAAVVGGALVGAAVLAVTGGMAAPAVGGAVGTLMGLSGAAATSGGLALFGGGSLAAGGFGMAGGVVALQTLFGVAGAATAANAIAKRAGDVKEFEVLTHSAGGLHHVIGVSGFLNQDADVRAEWQDMVGAWPDRSCHALRWESSERLALAKLIGHVSFKQAIGAATASAAKSASKAAALAAALPLTVINAIDTLIANPWAIATARSVKCGKMLAEYIAGDTFARNPVTLVGFSLGARLVLEGLAELDRLGVHDRIQDVHFLGGAANCNHPGFAAASRVVRGQVVNAYATNDMVLAILFRAAERTEPIGLAPLNRVGVVDVDLTDVVDGHLTYIPNLAKVMLAVKLRSALDEVG